MNTPADEILEYIPNEGEPYLVKGPKSYNASSEPVNEPVSESKSIPNASTSIDSKPKTRIDNYEEYAKKQSIALDQCFVDERGGQVIEGNEVLIRGEWLSVQKEEEEEEHCCAFCGKENVKYD